MKALLLKDWYVLRKQVWSYLLIVLVWGLIPSLTLNLLAVVYGAMIPYTAMAYDERSKWDQMAAMMPYSIRDIVLSKYLLGWGGVSVHCQTAAVLEETEISLGRYLLAKALQAVVSALLALAVCRFLF